MFTRISVIIIYNKKSWIFGALMEQIRFKTKEDPIFYTTVPKPFVKSIERAFF